MSMKGRIVEKSSIEWKIKHFFSTSSHADDVWYSPSFHLSDASWRIKLYPNTQTDCNSAWIYVYLEKQDSVTEFHEVNYTLGLKTSDGIKIKSMSGTYTFKSSMAFGSSKFYQIKELQDNKHKLFPDGTVTFFCEALLIGRENTVDADSRIDIRHCSSGLSQNFKDLFLTEAGADVTIKVKDKEFRAHSQILSARSPVLAAMFRHDTKEKNTGVVEIPEYDPDVFREFLIFLYSGQAEGLTSDNLIALYSASDKYDMEDLKARCSEFMKKNMSVDSICSFLSLAITYEDKGLIDFATNFFDDNIKKILVTVEWMSFVKQYPVESNELVIRAAQRLPDKSSMQ